MTISGLILSLRPRETAGTTIDGFLRSLAVSRRSGAFAVILSGTGSDGALGIQAVAPALRHHLFQVAVAERIPQKPSDAQNDDDVFEVPSSKQRWSLEQWARSRSLPLRQVERAKMVLLAAEGKTDLEIAARPGCGQRKE